MYAGGRLTLYRVTITQCSAASGAAGNTQGNAYGGALYVDPGGEVEIRGSVLRDCHSRHARAGGAARGGALYVLGSAILDDSLVTNCSAVAPFPSDGQGGAMYVADGTVLLSQRSLLVSNHASGVGSTLYAGGGVTTYQLPAPPGHWIAGQDCLVYRQACRRDVKGNFLNAACPATARECSFLLNESAHAADGTLCQPLLRSQPCSWEQTPQLIGKKVQVLPQSPLEGDLPAACAAGLLGSADAAFQADALCAGPCPAGFVCPSQGTTDPLPCPRGSACPPGSAVSLPCPPGRWSNATELVSTDLCLVCPAGSACSAGSQVPSLCAAGTFTAQQEQATCLPCPAGQFQPSTGQVLCQECTSGGYCKSGASAALPCPSGTFSDTTGLSDASQCKLCPAGSSCERGSSIPRACPPGTSASGLNNTECTLCEAGFYQPTFGASACTQCPAGHYSSNVLSCTPCPPGEWCALGAATGTPCRLSDGTTMGTGSLSEGDCVCKANLFMAVSTDGNRTCSPCPRGADCAAIGVTLEALPLLPNFWRSTQQSELLRGCYINGACLGGRNISEYCAPGYSGPFCDECQTGFVKNTLGRCAVCEGSALPLILLAAIPILAMVLGAVYSVWGGLARQPPCTREGSAKPVGEPTRRGMCGNMRKRLAPIRSAIDQKATSDELALGRGELELTALAEAAFGLGGGEAHKGPKGKGRWSMRLLISRYWVKIRIFISLCQVLSLLGIVFDIPYPGVYRFVLRLLGLFAFDFLEFLPLGCIFETNFHFTLLLRTAWPLILLAIVLVVRQPLRRSPSPSHRAMAEQLASMVFAIFFLVYPTTSSKIFLTFQCFTLDDVRQSSFLRADFSVDCNSPRHQLMQLYATVMIFVYPLGLPAFYSYLLYVRHGRPLKRLRVIAAHRQDMRKHAISQATYNALPSLGDSPTKATAAKGSTEGQCVPHNRCSIQEAATHARQGAVGGLLGLIGVKRVNAALARDMRNFAKQVADMQREEEAELRKLPDYISKLIAGYDLRVFWFEIFECLRKLALVCVPVFFHPAGSAQQLIFGLIVCFLTFGAYMLVSPYNEVGDTRLAELAQVQIFIALVMSIALKIETSTYASVSEPTIGILLSVLAFAPVALAVLMECAQLLYDFAGPSTVAATLQREIIRAATQGRSSLTGAVRRPSERHSTARRSSACRSSGCRSSKHCSTQADEPNEADGPWLGGLTSRDRTADDGGGQATDAEVPRTSMGAMLTMRMKGARESRAKSHTSSQRAAAIKLELEARRADRKGSLYVPPAQLPPPRSPLGSLHRAPSLLSRRSHLEDEQVSDLGSRKAVPCDDGPSTYRMCEGPPSSRTAFATRPSNILRIASRGVTFATNLTENQCHHGSPATPTGAGERHLVASELEAVGESVVAATQERVGEETSTVFVPVISQPQAPLPPQVEHGCEDSEVQA